MSGIWTFAEPAMNLARANPKSAAAFFAGITMIAAPGIVATPFLAVAGFTPGGVAASSLAAGFHSVVGPTVAAGSSFAVMQSAAMGGYGASAVCGGIQAGGGATVLVAAARSLF